MLREPSSPASRKPLQEHRAGKDLSVSLHGHESVIGPQAPNSSWVSGLIWLAKIQKSLVDHIRLQDDGIINIFHTEDGIQDPIVTRAGGPSGRQYCCYCSYH